MVNTQELFDARARERMLSASLAALKIQLDCTRKKKEFDRLLYLGRPDYEEHKAIKIKIKELKQAIEEEKATKGPADASEAATEKPADASDAATEKPADPASQGD